MIIEGAIAVKAAVLNGKRDIVKVYIDKDKKTKDFNFIRKSVRNKGILLLEWERSQIESLASGKSHGGILAEVSERKDDVFSNGDIFYLDGIEDPFNLGYSMRTLYALGVENLLLSPWERSSMEGQLLKSSAGAYDMLKVKTAKDPYTEIKSFKEMGYHIYGLYRGQDSKDIFDTVFAEKTLFLLGGEKRGISAQLLELCDETLYISYGSDFRNALNASGALDVTVTLLRNQRRRK